MATDDDLDLEAAFGQEVRAERARRRMSQRQLSQALESHGIRLDPTAVTRIEKRGGRGVRLAEAAAIASVLEINLNQLIEEYSEPQTRLQLLRNAAEDHARMGAYAISKTADSLIKIKRVLAKNPELVATLDPEPGKGPESPAAYLTWVRTRVAAVATHFQIDLSTTSVQDRRALKSLGRLLIDTLFGDDPDGPGSGEIQREPRSTAGRRS